MDTSQDNVTPTRPRGRPRKLNPRSSNNTIHVTLTDVERAIIDAAARLARKPPAVYAREKVFSAASLTQSSESSSFG
jgi:hypothetical protein